MILKNMNYVITLHYVLYSYIKRYYFYFLDHGEVIIYFKIRKKHNF